MTQFNLIYYDSMFRQQGQSHTPITVSSVSLPTPVNTFCGRNPEYLEKTTAFRKALTLLFSQKDWIRLTLRESLLKPELRPLR